MSDIARLLTYSYMSFDDSWRCLCESIQVLMAKAELSDMTPDMAPDLFPLPSPHELESGVFWFLEITLFLFLCN